MTSLRKEVKILVFSIFARAQRKHREYNSTFNVLNMDRGVVGVFT